MWALEQCLVIGGRPPSSAARAAARESKPCAMPRVSLTAGPLTCVLCNWDLDGNLVPVHPHPHWVEAESQAGGEVAVDGRISRVQVPV